MAAAPSGAAPCTVHDDCWRSLGTPRAELQLDYTLPTGQSFRWRRTAAGEYTGVIGQRVVSGVEQQTVQHWPASSCLASASAAARQSRRCPCRAPAHLPATQVALRQLEGDVEYRVLARGGAACPSRDAEALRDYFNLGTSLSALAAGWAAADARFAAVHPHLLGACAGRGARRGRRPALRLLLGQSPGGCLLEGAFCLESAWPGGRLQGQLSAPTCRQPCTDRACLASPPPLLHTERAAGARMLRQDPVECLFQFICSSNNHISRIGGMVERLCAAYGTPLHAVAADVQPPAAGGGAAPAPAAAAAPAVGAPAAAPTAAVPALARPQEAEAAAVGAPGEAGGGGVTFYAFPTLEQLAAATEEALRAAGFGYRQVRPSAGRARRAVSMLAPCCAPAAAPPDYLCPNPRRAKYITGSVAALLEKPGGGAAWLAALREAPYEEAAAALCALPGIGPKVRAGRWRRAAAQRGPLGTAGMHWIHEGFVPAISTMSACPCAASRCNLYQKPAAM